MKQLCERHLTKHIYREALPNTSIPGSSILHFELKATADKHAVLPRVDFSGILSESKFTPEAKRQQ